MHRPTLILSLVAAISSGALLASCSREDVTHVRVPKIATIAAAAPAAASMPAGVAAPPAVPGRALAWTLPAGWTQGAGGAMRFATLTPPVPGRIDGSVVALPGPAGGELANVNRWRGQVGLPPLDEAGLAGARTQLRTRAGPVAVYDFTGAGPARDRVVAGLAVVEGNTWFVKITGEAAAVGAAREDFMTLLRSLRLDAR